MRYVTPVLLALLLPAALAVAQPPSPSTSEVRLHDPHDATDPNVRHYLWAATCFDLIGEMEQAAWYRRMALEAVRTKGVLPPLTEARNQWWDGASWGDTYRFLFAYDGLDITEAVLQFKEGPVWQNFSRTLSTYSNHLVTETANQGWSGSEWRNFNGKRYTYSGDTLTTAFERIWADSAWHDTSRTLYTYSSGTLIEALSQAQTGSGWEDRHRWTYTYSGTNVTEVTDQYWTGTVWVNFFRTLSAYSGNFPTETADQTWTGSEWRYTFGKLYTYSDGSLIEEISRSWNDSDWANRSRVLYTYSGGDITETVSQDWDGSTWLNVEHMVNAYDADGTLNQRNFYSWADGGWVATQRTLLFYGTSTSTSDAKPSAEAVRLELYPNPLRSEAVIAFDLTQVGTVGFEVYDVMGRRVAVLPEQALGAGEQTIRWNLGALPAGVYVLKLQGAATATSRFVVVR